MRVRITILATIMALCLSTAAQAKYSGGTGEPNDPYLIATAEDMNAIGANPDDWDAHFLLVADINLADYNDRHDWPDDNDTQFKIIGNWDNPFTGVFDGNDHTISNFIYTAGFQLRGLFGRVGTDGQIKNLGMENIDINAENGGFVGGLVAVSFGTITNCYSTGVISEGGWLTGGLVGGNSGTITNCYATVSITATGDYTGGLVGYNDGTISNSYATSHVSGGEYYIGGLAGINVGTILDCYATGIASGYRSVGGLVGSNEDTITNCYSTCSASGYEEVGGMVGVNQKNGTIMNCYANGSTSGNECVGGLVGSNGSEQYYGGTISDSYATGDVDGNNCAGGLVGQNWSGTISSCYATGNISGDRGTGGLVGVNGCCDDCDVSITNCYATGSVDGNDCTGGLVGINCGWDVNSTISNCYATGTVNGNDYIGGLVGYSNYGCTISDCYATGSVTGGNCVGGLVGYFDTEWLQYECVIIRCYSVGSVIGENYVGGLAGGGRNYCVCYSFWDIETSGQTTSVGGTGKTTAEMKTASTYFGWSGCGETTWTIDEGNDYPHLAWEGKPGQPIQISDFLEGSGTQDDPYRISTAEQLNLIGLFTCELDKHFILENDVDIAEFTGIQFNIISGFTGVFDGNGKRIWNFTWDSNGEGYIGLFSYAGTGGQIKNLGLENVDVNATNGWSVGGLVGYNHQGTVINCYTTGSVSGRGYLEGGGPGGLVGLNSGTITNCYSTCNVTGEYNIGGLVGKNGYYNCNGKISNCYATGNVSGSYYVGGLVGVNFGGTATASFWDIETSGQNYSDGGTGLPTALMQTESTFTDAGWDFVCETVNGPNELWTIKEGVDYPKLIWQWNDYQEWLTAGKPLCWCCPRQCHGDTDNQKEGNAKTGYHYVHFKDLGLLLSAWDIKEPNYGDPYPGGPGIVWPDPNICADFDHGIEGSTKSGYWRVHYNDLAILLSNWNIKEPPSGPGIESNCLDCP